MKIIISGYQAHFMNSRRMKTPQDLLYNISISLATGFNSQKDNEEK